MIKRAHRGLINNLRSIITAHYGERLISLVLFGSFARGTATSESDLDILLIARNLPKRKMRRIEEFIDNIEDKLHNESHYISPIIKTPEEASVKSPLFLDMIHDAVILYDRDSYFQHILKGLKRRLKELGSQRIWRGNRWYWILKPDIKPGEVFEI